MTSTNLRYRIVRPLRLNNRDGRWVYLARNWRGDWRAIKFTLLPPEGTPDPAQTLQRAVREWRVGRALHHVNIARMYYSGQIKVPAAEGTRTIHYLAMEYVTGRSLDVILRKQGRFTLEDALEIMRQLLAGLGYAHANGVAAHRDIKPSNIMLTNRGGVVKILDFGVVRVDGSDVTGTRLSVGTERYMAAEQFNAKPPAGPQTDVYAAAAVFWELLTGFPLRTGTPQQIMCQVFDGELPAMPLSVPEELHPVLRTALSPQMSDRYDTAAEFWDAIVRAIPACDETRVLPTEQQMDPQPNWQQAPAVETLPWPHRLQAWGRYATWT